MIDMIRLPKKFCTEIVAWLDQNVSPNRPDLGSFPADEITAESRMNPWSINTAAMTARWIAQDGSWRVVQSANKSHVMVACKDPQIETFVATKWS